MTQTTNIGLKKIDGSENWRKIFDYHNDSADKTDSAVAAVQDGLAIVANGNTHAAVAEGQFVYVRNHSTLAEGLYKASSAIGTNAALSTSNLTADGSGGLNDLQEQVTSLNSKMPTFSDNHTGSATVNPGAFVTLASFDPPADGNYLIVVNAEFGGDTSGIRILMVSLTETDVNEPSNSVLASGRSSLQYVQLWGGVTTANRVYIRAYQNAENAITVNYRYRFIRL